ncbi:hypothetical protein CISIN_1g046869mg [Citrus sinensis]|uniref:Uncharacterized protein n=1 Tax=Citrus sinensis TaxID=2711 RepID=A0A067CZW4_CITSI|nr:hypothetical protein CISIN_1g046869mg [Citrus sinensis]
MTSLLQFIAATLTAARLLVVFQQDLGTCCIQFIAAISHTHILAATSAQDNKKQSGVHTHKKKNCNNNSNTNSNTSNTSSKKKSSRNNSSINSSTSNASSKKNSSSNNLAKGSRVALCEWMRRERS